MKTRSYLSLPASSSAAVSSPNCASRPKSITSVRECSGCYKISVMSKNSSGLKTTVSELTSWKKRFVCSRPTSSKTTAFTIKSVFGTLLSAAQFTNPFAS